MTDRARRADTDSSDYPQQRIAGLFEFAQLLHAESFPLIEGLSPDSDAVREASELALVGDLIIESEHLGVLAQRIMLNRELRLGAARTEREFGTVTQIVKMDESLKLLREIDIPDFTNPQGNREEKSSEIPAVNSDKL